MTSALRRRLPILTNLYVGQVLFGVAAALLAAPLVAHATGGAALARGGVVARIVALVLLTLVFGVYLQNLHRFGLVPDYSLKCRFCNGPVNRYSEFCEHCGADLIDPEKLLACPGCGVEVYEGTRHCPECGARIGVTKGKGKGKGKKPKREKETETASVGWSTPVDAVSGFPPDDERR